MPPQMVKSDPEERESSPYATSVTIHKLYLQQTLVICTDYVHLHFLSEGIHFLFPLPLDCPSANTAPFLDTINTRGQQLVLKIVSKIEINSMSHDGQILIRVCQYK
jgi:hypothetical protein